jgi:hypothetical protein
MNRAQLALMLVLVAILVIFYFARYRLGIQDYFALKDTRPLPSSVDGLPYRVHTSHADAQKAADVMAQINQRAVMLMRHLRGKYARGTPEGSGLPPGSWDKRAAATRRLLNRYNPDNLAENSPLDPSGDTSYTIDKGSVLALCLRSREDHNLHDFDTLMFVALHEMAHIATDVTDHPPEFWSTFRWLLDEARDARIFAAPDFNRYPTTYCGMLVRHNPQYDGRTPSI